MLSVTLEKIEIQKLTTLKSIFHMLIISYNIYINFYIL